MSAGTRALRSAELARPRLDLSGPKLTQAFEALVARAEGDGGVERYVEALQLKSRMFRAGLGAGAAPRLAASTFKTLCALMAPVRRRIGAHLASPGFEQLRARLVALLEGAEDTATTDERLSAFCNAFPPDRSHRWVRDLAAEVLHNVDPERYPLMCRWVWDARTGTGVMREIWHDEGGAYTTIGVPDGYGTFVVLREELAQFLSANGVFRDVIYYIDLLAAQVYADYIADQGSVYMRADFTTPVDPMEHACRLLGLDGLNDKGRTRVKCVDGDAVLVDDPKLLD